MKADKCLVIGAIQGVCVIAWPTSRRKKVALMHNGDVIILERERERMCHSYMQFAVQCDDNELLKSVTV